LSLVNPATQADARRGAISFKAIAEKILDGEITIDEAGEMRKITRREKMVLGIIEDAVNDKDPNIRLKAVAYIMEKTEGKTPEKVELSTAEFNVDKLSAQEAEALLSLLEKAKADE